MGVGVELHQLGQFAAPSLYPVGRALGKGRYRELCVGLFDVGPDVFRHDGSKFIVEHVVELLGELAVLFDVRPVVLEKGLEVNRVIQLCEQLIRVLFEERRHELLDFVDGLDAGLCLQVPLNGELFGEVVVLFGEECVDSLY